MTDVLRNDFSLINSSKDVAHLYQGNGLPDNRQTIGFETEIRLYRVDQSGKPSGVSAQDCARLISALKAKGESPQLEMDSTVEYASPPAEIRDTRKLADQIKTSLGVYGETIREQGFLPATGAFLPFVTLESAKEDLVDRDRARGLVKGMGLFKPEEFLKVTLLATSTQVSLGYKNPDDLYDIAATTYALGPAIFGLFANHPKYIENRAEPVDFHPRAKFYEAFGKDGGVPDSLLKAKNGQEFINNHIDQVFETQMLFYYGPDKNLVWPEKPVTFSELKGSGLNTRSNYDLAESFVYNDLKICNIRDENGTPTGKRVEIRGFDAGAPGTISAVPFAAAVLRDQDTRESVKGLLLDYGFAPDLPGWGERLKDARHAAANHGGKFLDVPFGVRPNGEEGSLKDFCRELGVLLQLHARRNPELQESLNPVIEICKTGVSEAEKQARNTPDYAHALEALKPSEVKAPLAQKLG